MNMNDVLLKLAREIIKKGETKPGVLQCFVPAEYTNNKETAEIHDVVNANIEHGEEPITHYSRHWQNFDERLVSLCFYSSEGYGASPNVKLEDSRTVTI